MKQSRHCCVVEPIESRVLLAAVAGEEVVFDAASGPAVVVEADGTTVTLSLAGPGTGRAGVTEAGVVVRLEGTTDKSTLVAAPDPATGRAALARLDVQRSLGRLVAPRLDLAGDVNVAGALRQADLGDAPGITRSSVRIGAGQRAALTFGRVRDLGIDSPAGLASVTAAGWDDDPANGPDPVTAAAVGRFVVNGDARLELRAGRVGAMAVAGDLVDSKLILMPDGRAGRGGLGSLAVGGAMRGSWVNALADIGQITTGGMIDSVVAAGVAYAETSPGVFEQPLPAKTFSDFGSFTGKYAIRSVTVNSRVGQEYAFANSRVGAYRIGSVRLDGVRGDNGHRPFGAAAYLLNRLLRRFVGSQAGQPTGMDMGTDFVVRQIFAPLVFRPGPGGYGGYYGGNTPGMGFVKVVVTSDPNWTYVPIGENGVPIGSVTRHASSTGIFLNPNNTYDARDAAGAVVAGPGPLADVILAAAGTPGVSMKVEVKPALGTADGSLTFLGTSVGAEVVIPVPANPVRYLPPAAPGTYVPPISVPAQSDLVAAMRAAGVEVQEFARPLLRLRADGIEVARRFDDTGLRRARLLADHTYAMTDAYGATLAAGASLADVLFHGEGPPLGGRQRFPAWLVTTANKVTVHGLARGGTVVFDKPFEQVIDPAGAVFTTPGGEELQTWMGQHGVRVQHFTG